jgi:MFS family permease
VDLVYWIVPASLIAIAIVTLLVVLARPRRRRNPEDGMAVGCLGIVIVGLVLLGGLLALAVHFQIHWLIRAIFWATALPTALLIPQLLYPKLKRKRIIPRSD